MARICVAERHAVRQAVPHASGPGVQRGCRPHALGVVPRRGEGDRTRTHRPKGAVEARRVGVVHRGLVATQAPIPEEGRTARPEGAGRADREGDDADEEGRKWYPFPPPVAAARWTGISASSTLYP